MLFPGEQKNFQSSLLRSVQQCESPVSGPFFSAQNFEAIQTGLRQIMLQKTGYLIRRQSDEQLSIVMRATYATHARYPVDDPNREIQRLNAIVLAEIAPGVATAMSQYIQYLKDASELAVPTDRPESTSAKGTKTSIAFKPL